MSTNETESVRKRAKQANNRDIELTADDNSKNMTDISRSSNECFASSGSRTTQPGLVLAFDMNVTQAMYARHIPLSYPLTRTGACVVKVQY